MTISSILCCAFIRRARARRLLIASPGESSIQRSAWVSVSIALAIFWNAIESAWPVRSMYESTCASLQMSRCTSDWRDISSENTTTGLPASTAALRAMLSAKRRLADRGAGREDDQLARLQPLGEHVELREVGRDAGDQLLVLDALLEGVPPLAHHRRDVAHLRAAALLADLEDRPARPGRSPPAPGWCCRTRAGSPRRPPR